jgi:uncharacterized protein
MQLKQQQEAQLASICAAYHIAQLELFGSQANGRATEQSDVDLLVTFVPGRTPGFAFFDLHRELEQLFGKPVDLLLRECVEHDPLPARRARMLNTAQVLHAA